MRYVYYNVSRETLILYSIDNTLRFYLSN